MTYDSLIYVFLFLPLCLLIYQAVPVRWRRFVLLGFSYLFFYLLSGRLVIYLLGTTLLTHCIGIWLEFLRAGEKEQLKGAVKEEKKQIRAQWQRKRKRALVLGVGILLLILANMKYYNFLVRNLSQLMGAGLLPFSLQEKQVLMPIGISFYTLQAIGYMADVYWGKVKAETELSKTALFLGFFPQIMEGPICRHSDTADTLYASRSLEMSNLVEGFVRIFWGLFKKKVVADRLNILVAAVFDHYENYGGVVVVVSAVAYTIQLYMEFSGCMDIVIGSGRLFGIVLPENFRQPFCSRSAAGFWRRWHITLGVWFKEYIFYPVSVSGPVKKWNQYGRKHMGKYVTRLVTSAMGLFPVWLCNGLWHGARWSYLFYGMYYFVLILAGIAVEPLRDRFFALTHIPEQGRFWKLVTRMKTWVIIFTGELFFRANGLKAGMSMFRSIFHGFDLGQLFDGTLLTLGMGKADFVAVIAGCLVVGVVGSLKERGIPVIQSLGRKPLPVRWLVYYGLLLSVILFAAYGDGYQAVDLIYAGF